MPFISKDWRSPGEEWVKYDGGWEKKSVVTIQDAVMTPQHLDLSIEVKEVKSEVIDRPLNVAEAVATLNRGLKNCSNRKKNFSESNSDQNDKENLNPASRFEVMLQEHVRRIRGQIVEEINHNDVSQENGSQKSSR